MSAHPLLTDQGTAQPALLALLRLLGISHERTLPEIVSSTQKAWLRKTLERWHLQELYPEKRRAALPLLRQLGCVECVFPSKKQYEVAVVLGGYEDRVRARFAYLRDIWGQGIRFHQLLFLTGERALDQEHEETSGSLRTETEMMENLFKEIEMPVGLRAIPLKIINTPMQTENGMKRRPNTADSMREWLKESPSPSSLLFISNQPFIGYQHAVAQTELPATFSFETVGPKAEEDTLLALYLDNLARWLYQENLRRTR